MTSVAEREHEFKSGDAQPGTESACGEHLNVDAGLEALRVIRHDFKTPLTSLKMLAQIFKVGVEKGTLARDRERTERNCKMMIDQVDKLVHLADQLYEISVAQSGRLKMARQHCDLRPVLSNVVLQFSDRIKNIELPENAIWGEWDTAKLEEAFSFLLSEAKSVNILVELHENSVVIKFSGEYKIMNEKTAPSRFIAREIFRLHGGTLQNQFEIVLPIKN